MKQSNNLTSFTPSTASMKTEFVPGPGAYNPVLK